MNKKILHLINMGILLILLAVSVGGCGFPISAETSLMIQITYGPAEQAVISKTELVNAVTVVRMRLDYYQIVERQIKVNYDKCVIDVRFSVPADITDTTALIANLGAINRLTFTDSKGQIILEGNDVDQAIAAFDANNSPVVTLTLTEECTRKFADATKLNIDKPIMIKMDDLLLSKPVVKQAITNGRCLIDGLADAESAVRLAGLINSGALPSSLIIKAVQVRSSAK
jgi:hypothetical protein